MFHQLLDAELAQVNAIHPPKLLLAEDGARLADALNGEVLY